MGLLARDSQDHGESNGHAKTSLIVRERTDGAGHPRPQAVARCSVVFSCMSIQ